MASFVSFFGFLLYCRCPKFEEEVLGRFSCTLPLLAYSAIVSLDNSLKRDATKEI